VTPHKRLIYCWTPPTKKLVQYHYEIRVLYHTTLCLLFYFFLVFAEREGEEMTFCPPVLTFGCSLIFVLTHHRCLFFSDDARDHEAGRASPPWLLASSSAVAAVLLYGGWRCCGCGSGVVSRAGRGRLQQAVPAPWGGAGDGASLKGHTGPGRTRGSRQHGQQWLVASGLLA
jgi:hypothetical protein